MLIKDGEQVMILTREELERIISKAVEKAMAVYFFKNPPPKKPEPDQYLDKKEVAKMLDVSVSTVDNLRRSGRLKSYNVRRRVKFRLKEVQAYLER